MKKSGKLMGLLGTMALVGALSNVSAALGSWNITTMLNSWADAGIFSYVLPFLLIFAIIFGILKKSSILGENTAVNVIIAVAIGLLSLVGDFVPRFFQGLFPYLGMGLSILIAAVILLGLFFEGGDSSIKKTTMWLLFGVGAIVFIVVVYSSLDNYNFAAFNFWNDYGPSILTLLVIAAIIALISVSSSKSKPKA